MPWERQMFTTTHHILSILLIVKLYVTQHRTPGNCFVSISWGRLLNNKHWCQFVDTLYNYNFLLVRLDCFWSQASGEYRDKNLYIAIINQLRDNHTNINHNKTRHQSSHFLQVQHTHSFLAPPTLLLQGPGSHDRHFLSLNPDLWHNVLVIAILLRAGPPPSSLYLVRNNYCHNLDSRADVAIISAT